MCGAGYPELASVNSDDEDAVPDLDQHALEEAAEAGRLDFADRLSAGHASDQVRHQKLLLM
jgi:hypothetical protein